MAGDTFNTSTGYENVRGSNKTPEQLAEERRLAQIAADKRAQAATATANNAHVASSGRRAEAAARDTHAASVAGRGAGIELPFIGAIPYAGPILEGAVEGLQGGALAVADYAVDHPLETVATGGLAAGISGADKLADEVASGVAQGIKGNSRASFDVPLTPAQLWDPDGPIYDPGNIDGSGTVDAFGVKDIGEAGIEAVSDLGAGLADLFSGGGAGSVGNTGSGYGTQVAKAAIENAANEQARARQLGMDVLSGNVGAPSSEDRTLQLSELERIQGFMSGPRSTQEVLSGVDELLATPGAQQNVFSEASRARAAPSAQSGVLGRVDNFLSTPTGPSAAELQLKQAQDDSMSDALSLAAGARGGPGAVARARRVAMAENAATQSVASRDLALLRAKEEEAKRAEVLKGLGLSADLAGGIDQRDLQALGIQQGAAAGMDDRALRGAGLKGELASGLDRDTLQALGLGGELASNLGAQGVTQRGQTLGLAGDLLGGALDSTTGIASTAIPAYLRDDLDRAKLGYELTPDQKMLFASLGAGSDLLSLFL